MSEWPCDARACPRPRRLPVLGARRLPRRVPGQAAARRSWSSASASSPRSSCSPSCWRSAGAACRGVVFPAAACRGRAVDRACRVLPRAGGGEDGRRRPDRRDQRRDPGARRHRVGRPAGCGPGRRPRARGRRRDAVRALDRDGAGGRAGIGAAVVAAIGLGSSLVFIEQASDHGVLPTLLVARCAGLATLAVALAVTRPSRRARRRAAAGAVLGIGLLDMAATGLFALARRRVS